MTVPHELDPRWSSLETVLREQGAWQDFTTLVSATCDPNELAVRIVLLTRDDSEHDAVEYFFGRNRRQVKSAAKNLRKCGDLTTSLSSNRFAGFLATTAPELLRLPSLLAQYSRHVLSALDALGPKQHVTANLRLMDLVVYVESRADTPHDREVAAIVAAALGKSYSAEAHKDWRLSHSELAQLLRLRASVTPPPPPPE